MREKLAKESYYSQFEKGEIGRAWEQLKFLNKDIAKIHYDLADQQIAIFKEFIETDSVLVEEVSEILKNLTVSSVYHTFEDRARAVISHIGNYILEAKE